jgi:hypothetical protein
MRFKAMSLLKRLFNKIVQDALPAGLASILGGLLLTHFQIDRVPQPTTVKVTPASPEMMQLLRDEHGMILSFVKEQVATEKNRADADQASQRVAAEAAPPPPVQAAPATSAQRPIPVAALAASKPAAAPRNKNPIVGASLPPAAPVQLQPTESAQQPAAHTDDSLLARTIGIKDRVVTATQHAVSATIGVIPSWFGSLGDHIGGDGQSQSPRPPADLVSASWIVPAAER